MRTANIEFAALAILLAGLLGSAAAAGGEQPAVKQRPSDGVGSSGSVQDSSTEAPSTPHTSQSELIAKLREVAYGTNADGEFKEPSVRVREVAKKALLLYANQAPPVDGALPAAVTAPASEQRAGETSPAGQSVTAVLAEGRSDVNRANGEGPVEPTVSGMRNPYRAEDLDRSDHLGPEVPPRSIVLVGDQFVLIDYQGPIAPVQPITPPPTTTPAPIQPTAPTSPQPWGQTEAKFVSIADILQQAKDLPPGPPVEGTGQQEQRATLPTGTGDLLKQSDSVQTVETQRRSPVAMDPHIRGLRWGQIYTQADGAYWTPARLDLDTMLNKIDPGMVGGVVVMPGPYGLRYGPGFAFIDVQRVPTPRYCDGFQAHLDTTGGIRTNGGQLYWRETAFGGAEDWGFRLSYGDRKGSDYQAGNGLKIPSSYDSRDVWGELSYNVTPHRRIDFAYMRMDQLDTEYPAQFFDLDFLGTYGFQARMVDDDPCAPWTRLTAAAWYNRTWFHGDTTRKNNPRFPVMQRVNWSLDEEFGYPHNPDPNISTLSLLGTTSGTEYSSGARVGVTFGDEEYTQFSAGADLRYVGQGIREDYLINGPPDPYIDPAFSTNMPHAWMTDPGVYAEVSQPLTERWTVSVGARLDYVRTTARADDLRYLPDIASPTGRIYDGSLPGIDLFLEDTSVLQEDNLLYAFYLTNRLKLGEHWTLTGGFGQAQRPPTLIERYADGLFLSVLQSGFTHTIGSPALKPERDWQIDVGLAAEYDNWRGRISAFQSWIVDYVTFEGSSVFDPEFLDARLLQFVNTDMATLDGVEAYGEYDWTPRLTPFAKLGYVEGRDRGLQAPLFGIPPLDGSVGIRLHDPEKGRRWGIEVAARMVAPQNRLGALRGIDSPVEERTAGFAVCNLRTYYNYTKNLSLVAGIDNVFDKNYQEHLDLRLRGPAGFPERITRVFEPGFTPYFGLNWVF